MATSKPTEAEEAAFMKALLGDDSFWNAVPTPDPSPIKLNSRPQHTPIKRLGDSSKPSIRNPVAAVPSPSKVFSAGDVDMASLLDGAEDWDWDDTDPFTPKKSPKKKSPAKHSLSSSAKANPTFIRETCTRCIVVSISEADVNGRWSKKLKVKLDPSEERRQVILLDDWIHTDVRVGDTINVLGTFTAISPSSSSLTSTIFITSQLNLLILHPDLLLTATALSNALQCRRKPLLSTLVRSSSDTTPALVWGNMLHDVMQTCLTQARWDETWIEERIDDVISKNLSQLVKLDVTIQQAKREVSTRAKGLKAFAERYVSETPKPEAILTNTRSTANQAPSLLAISELLDIEEDIWSPTYGIKGKLDATVNTVIFDPSPTQSIFKIRPTVTSGPKPFEIKTGRTVAGLEHRAQTMLYTLLAEERYGTEVPSGLLYYTQSDEVVRVPASRNELRGLIVARNEMAGYMMRRHKKSDEDDIEIEGVGRVSEEEPFLPPTIDDERACKRCYALDTCMLYRKAIEGPMDSSSPIYDTYDLKTSHLTKVQTEFFKKWEALISMEERDLLKFKKELWTMGAAEREKKGRCFAGMILDESFRPSTSSEPIATLTSGAGVSLESKIHKYSYRFLRAQNTRADGNLLHGHMSVNEPITVSVEPHLLAFAKGFIVDLAPSEVVVGIDHPISMKTIAERVGTKDIIFRIDKDELFGGMGRIRDNLAHMFYADGDSRRLRLVVDLVAPRFYSPLEIPPSIEKFTRGLNPNQQAAIHKVLSAEDYALILGMPGTGKTTVVAALIKSLVEMGKSVLLSSYTHSAVDTILQKLNGADFGILRLGNVDKIHPDVVKYTLAARTTATSMEQLEAQLMSPPVVATTCLSVDHALFNRRKFDYCIVDEASQITLPTCLGPLRFADTFVLVGDHFQLPPLVRNRDARKGGLDVSLFRRLSEAHPPAVVDLAYQYRMNEDIMLLSNTLIYHNRLRCGSEEVAKQSLMLPDRAFLNQLHCNGTSNCLQGDKSQCWIERLASESCKAVFVDTDSIEAQDSRVGDLIQNEVEAQLVCQITETLLRSGVREEQIGIISLYRQQVKFLSHLLQARKNIEILTADRSQGRDKDCIIISLVRSNDAGQVGDLVKDWRRMNVSFTRARSKLIMFGSRKTLQSAPLLSQFFELMERQNWILKLPHAAEKVHAKAFEPCSTPSKRRALDFVVVKESVNNIEVERPQKKMKVKREGLDTGMLRGRPVLNDLIHDNV